MNFYIIIPAHNEESSIGLTLNSLINQSLLPKQLIVVNDNSTDNTQNIIEAYSTKHSWISLVNHKSSNTHIPGSKVIEAFYKGVSLLDDNYDVICKFDGDIILPHNYLEQIALLFKENKSVGIAGGLAFIQKNDTWVYENIASKNHVRGPIKAYRKDCFKAIGGLKPSIGWDTVDTLLAKYYGWEIQTDKSLQVKHLKPTGENYNKGLKHLQGEAMHKMRYGFLITLISGIKQAYLRKNYTLVLTYLSGYFNAKKNNIPFLVTESEGKFIRHIRWQGILGKFKK